MELGMVHRQGLDFMNKDLVISIYNEEITWLKKRKFNNERVFAYKKFERFDYDFIELLPNVGRESHTYIHHILKQYNSEKSDYTIFLQGDPYPHLFGGPDSIPYMIFDNSYKLTHAYYPLGELVICNEFGHPLSKWQCELYSLWDSLFEADIPNQFIANYGAQHAVHKSILQSRSKKFWEKALELHFEFEHTPWAYEILWHYIFDPRFKSRF